MMEAIGEAWAVVDAVQYLEDLRASGLSSWGVGTGTLKCWWKEWADSKDYPEVAAQTLPELAGKVKAYLAAKAALEAKPDESAG